MGLFLPVPKAGRARMSNIRVADSSYGFGRTLSGIAIVQLAFGQPENTFEVVVLVPQYS